MLIRKATKKDARRISYLIKKNTENVLENGYTNEQIATWKKGIESKLLQHLENYARKNNINELVLTSTPSAKKFYTSKGYETLKTVVVKVKNVDFKETAMRKKL